MTPSVRGGMGGGEFKRGARNVERSVCSGSAHARVAVTLGER
jgi:hypothetical protein